MTSRLTELKSLLLHETAMVDEPGLALVTHRNPDGDGLAACLALQELLRRRGVHADIVLEGPCPDSYDFLDGAARTRVMQDDLAYECLVLLDCHEQARIGTCAPLVQRASHVIAIDHHHERELIPGAHTYIDTEIVSVGGILWQLFSDEIAALPDSSRRYILQALYTTVLNDTDNFVNANTDSRTFDICRQMADLGLEAGPVARHFIWGKSAAEMQLVGEVLGSMKMLRNGRVMFLHSTRAMLSELGLGGEATSKMTRWVKGVRGVEAIVYFREVDDNRYRLSLRSDGVDVNRIARSHGGGGHTRAAGCELTGTLDEVQLIILRQLEEQL